MKKISPPKAKAVQDGASDDGVKFPTQSEVSPVEHHLASSPESSPFDRVLQTPHLIKRSFS